MFGGRLQSSLLAFDSKHPIIMPPKHPLTKLLMENYHKDNLHAGPQALLAAIRQRF